jgi:MFS family permease
VTNTKMSMSESGTDERTTDAAGAQRRLPRNVLALTVTSLLNDISSEMLINLLPLFLFNVLGVRTSVIGLIEGVAETTASLLKIFSGWFSDRMRLRKRLAVLGYSLSTLAKPLLYFATTWGWVLGVRFADRVGKGIRTAPRDAMVADSIDERRRGLAFGFHRAGDTAGAVIGMAVALLVLLAAQRGSTLLTRSSFQVIVLLSLIPAALAVIVLVLGVQEVSPVERVTDSMHSAGAERRTTRKTGFDRRFHLFLLIVLLFTLGNSSDAFLILRAQTVGLSVIGVMGMMLTFSLVYALVSIPAGALSDRVGRRRLLIGGWVLYTLVYLGFARAGAGWQVWLLMSVYGIYYGLTEGVAKAFVADLVPVDRRGTAYGLYNAIIGLAAFPASMVAGILWQGVGKWQGFGPAAPFLLGAALALIASLLLVLHPADKTKLGLEQGGR